MNAAALPELVALAQFVVDHPRAASGMGDRPHAEWAEMQRMAREALAKASEPVPLTNCLTCRWNAALPGGVETCEEPTEDNHGSINEWSRENCDRETWKCRPDATGCPGFKPRPESTTTTESPK